MNPQEFASLNPATGDVVWKGKAASQHDVDKAVSLSKMAFENWTILPIEERIRHLESFCEKLKSSNVLAEAISKETGKPLWESDTEVNAMIGKIGISIEAYHDRCPETILTTPGGNSLTRHKPHGVVAVLGPFNFPGHLPNGHIVPALLAGNTVIFKPSEHTPLVGEITLAIWRDSGLPEGVLNLVQGGRESGAALAFHQEIDGLFFTGSWPTGKLLAEQFASRPEKILALEMGGNNPLVVSQISDKKAAAYLTILSAYLTAGQRCSCARRLIVLEGPQGDAFLQTLQSMIAGIKVGNYTEKPEPFMGPVISVSAAETILKAQNRLKSQGGHPLVEMRLLKPCSAFLSPGLMDVTDVDERPDEEIFGPFLQVIRVPDFAAAIHEANHTQYGLTAGLLSDDPAKYEEFYRKVKAGVINWNTQLTGAGSRAPFGGVGRSGNHHPSAYYAADYCSYPVASTESVQLKMPTSLAQGVNGVD